MRAGIFIAYWPWFTPEEQLELTILADELGLDSVWVAEAWGQDAVSLSGYLAARTEQIAIGTALMQIPARPPTATAMAAATIDVLSGGRFRLGLGVSGPQVSEGWYGVPFAKPVTRTREYVEIVRMALAGEKVVYKGKAFELPLPDGLGKPLRLLATPVQRPIPVYLGAVGPKAVEQVGEIADGWLPFMVDPESADALFGPLKVGLEKAGRTLADIDVAAAVPVGLSDDLDAARGAVKPLLAFYMGAMGAKEKNFYVELAERAGFGDEARRVQALWLAREHAAALDAVTDALVDRLAVACTPSQLEGRLAAYADVGVDTLGLRPLRAGSPGDRSCAGGDTCLRVSPGPFPSAATPPGCATSCAPSRASSSSARSLASRSAALVSIGSCATRSARCRARCGGRTGRRSACHRWATERRSWSPAAATSTRARGPLRPGSPSPSSTSAWPARATCWPSSPRCAAAWRRRACSRPSNTWSARCCHVASA